jgi:hypothetical protein
MIPAGASMSTQCLHLSAVRLSLRLQNYNFLIIGLKTEELFMMKTSNP